MGSCARPPRSRAIGTVLAPLCALTLMFAPGTAGAAGCAVATSTASAASPHVRDPLGDATVGNAAVPAPGHAEALDIRALWLKLGSGGALTANLTVTSLATHPVGAVYYVEFANQPWLSARALPDGSWTFGSGLSSWTLPMAGVREEAQSEGGTVTGNTISITVPRSYVPARPGNGDAVRISAPAVRTAYSLRAPVAAPAATGAYATTDTGDNATYCDVLLYG